MPPTAHRPPPSGEGDVTLRCCQCGADFVWSEGEQRWFASKGLKTPKRCLACREERKTGGTYGTQVVSVDSLFGEVLCRRCRRPASRSASFLAQEALCSACACGSPDAITEERDHLAYAEWEERFKRGK